MDVLYTSNKLVQFIYGEASFKEYFKLDDAMEEDPALRVEFRALYDSVKNLPTLSLNPSSKTLENILTYSKENL